MSKDPSDNWFAALLKPNGLRLAQSNLARQGFACFAPRQLESVTRKGKLADVSKLLFPGYVFVQFDPNTRGWQSINATRGISRLIVHDIRHPIPLPAPFMAGLMARCDDTGLIKNGIELSIGDEIRVLSGPFADVITKIDELDADGRLQVLIDLMGQKVRTTLPPTSVNRL